MFTCYINDFYLMVIYFTKKVAKLYLFLYLLGQQK